jgi:hypothetical protein
MGLHLRLENYRYSIANLAVLAPDFVPTPPLHFKDGRKLRQLGCYWSFVVA